MNAMLKPMETTYSHNAGARPLQTDSLPSISASAMLVNLRINMWSADITDKSATSDIQHQSGAIRGSARVRKSLLPDEPIFDRVKSLLGLMRNTHYSLTMPWEDRGSRVLTMPLYFRYQTDLGELNTEYKTALGNFLNEYPAMVARAPSKLNALFDPSDYPDVDDLANKFSVGIQYSPVPEAGDFRVDVGNEALQMLKSSYENFYEEKLKGAYADAWERTHKVLSHMSTKLEGQTKQKFNDTLVSNVTEMVELLDGFNVTNDPEMARASRLIGDALRGVTPDGLRSCDSYRLETKRKVDDLLKEFTW